MLPRELRRCTMSAGLILNPVTGVIIHCKALWVVSHTRKALYKNQLLVLLLFPALFWTLTTFERNKLVHSKLKIVMNRLKLISVPKCKIIWKSLHNSFNRVLNPVFVPAHYCQANFEPQISQFCLLLFNNFFCIVDEWYKAITNEWDPMKCDPASQNHQKVARHGFLVKGKF